MRRWLSRLIFPATLLASLGAASAALGRGAEPGAVLGATALGATALVAALERALPFRRAWNRSRGDLRADLAYLPTALGINALLETGVKVVAVAAGAALSDAFGVGLWPGGWPLAAQLVVACIVAELFDYWPHRWMHAHPGLWRFHLIHHSPERLYWLNATRAHPVELLFRGVFAFLPLTLLGAGGDVLALFALTTIVVGLFQHANVDTELGPLAWIFSVGEMHRWHHSTDLAEAAHNFGNNFLFWDVVFGSWYRPRGRAPEKLGVGGLEGFPASWLRQLAEPFRRRSPA